VSTSKKTVLLRRMWLSAQSDRLDSWVSHCESPIEELFLLGLLAGRSVDEETPETLVSERLPWERLNDRLRWEAARAWILRQHRLDTTVAGIYADADIWFDHSTGDWKSPLILPQCHVSTGGVRYRVDFALICQSVKVAIELDGHDFHERTKQQAKRDKSRDRALSREGWNVVRYTGSEVYEDVHACIDDVLEITSKLLFDRRGRTT